MARYCGFAILQFSGLVFVSLSRVPWTSSDQSLPLPQVSSMLVAVLVAIFVGVTTAFGTYDDGYGGYDDGYGGDDDGWYAAPRKH